MSIPDIMTVPQMAEYLQIGKNSAYALISSGLIPSVKIGRQIRIYREDVLTFLFKQKQELRKNI